MMMPEKMMWKGRDNPGGLPDKEPVPGPSPLSREEEIVKKKVGPGRAESSVPLKCTPGTTQTSAHEK